MKRITAIFGAALLLAGLAFGCNRAEPANAQLTDSTDSYTWAEPTLPETETQPVEPTDTDPEETTQAAAITKSTTTTKNNTITSKKTTTTTKTNSTNTTKSTTAGAGKTTTQFYANGIKLESKEAALSAFNAAVKTAVDGKAAFNKSHLIAGQNWDFDESFLEVVPNLGGLVDPASTISGAINAALGKGVRTATAQKGSSTNLIKKSSLSINDTKDVSYTGTSGSGYTVTVSVKDGETRQEKRLFGNNKSTGSSPIDKGPLNQVTSNGLYDHMDADKIFGLMQSAFSFLNVEPIDISESTSGVKYVAKLDGQGRLIELTCTYNQTINLREFRVLNGAKAYKDNEGSSSVTVTYDAFMY